MAQASPMITVENIYCNLRDIGERIAKERGLKEDVDPK